MPAPPVVAAPPTRAAGPLAPPPVAAPAPAPTRPAGLRLLGHTPALDGLRGLAWAAVFVTHASLVPALAGGQTSMFVFFGLSGFLITALLVNERTVSGRVSLGRFFARRAYRLVPALVAFLVAWLAVVVVFGHHPWIRSIPGGTPGLAEPVGVALQGVTAGALYLSNWFDIAHLFTGYVPLGHLWSLAVEEQVYLVWAPLLVVLLRWRRMAAVVVALVGAAASLGEVFALELARHGYGGDRMYMGTDTRAAAFLLGAAVAVLWASGRLVAWERPRANAAVAGVALALLAVGVVWMQQADPPVTYGLTWTAATLGGPLLVAALVTRGAGGVGAFLSGGLLTYLGRRSYGLYLWHYVWLTWLRSLGGAGIALALALTLATAELSWRVVEAPWLARKRRLAVTPAAVTPAPA